MQNPPGTLDLFALALVAQLSANNMKAHGSAHLITHMHHTYLNLMSYII